MTLKPRAPEQPVLGNAELAGEDQGQEHDSPHLFRGGMEYLPGDEDCADPRSTNSTEGRRLPTTILLNHQAGNCKRGRDSCRSAGLQLRRHDLEEERQPRGPKRSPAWPAPAARACWRRGAGSTSCAQGPAREDRRGCRCARESALSTKQKGFWQANTVREILARA